MTPDRHTGGSVFTRTGPLAAVIGIHVAIVYLLAVSMGVVDAPKFAQPIEAVFIPEPTQPEPEEPIVKPEIEDIAAPSEQPPPEIQFDDVIVPPAETPLPAANNAVAATAVSGAPRDLKTSTRTEPTYPPASRRAGEEGTVRLKVLVDESGRPKDVQVAQTSGFNRLDEAAKQAVRRWRFQAANDGNGPISVWTQVAITFRLTES
jgi:periplasmic protein TonB